MKFAFGIIIGAAFLMPLQTYAQNTPPGTDIFLLDLGTAEAKNITDRPGYDNQPEFSTDGSVIYFTRIEESQADIYQYELAANSISAVTQSQESEYSPTPIPGENALSVIRVGADQRQLLWAIPLDGSPPEVIFPDIEPVGYHAWSDDGVALLFVLGEPFTLQRAHSGKPPLTIARNIGRAIVTVPGTGTVAYVQKYEDLPWQIRTVESGAPELVTETIEGKEDFAIGPDGRFWMGDQSALYFWSEQTESASWQKFADLTESGVRNISRLAVSPDGRYLALVSDE